MSRTITATSRLRALVAAGALPEDAHVRARGRRCSWQERGMEMQLSLEPVGPRHPMEIGQWTLFVSPRGVLGRPSESGGAGAVVAVKARSVDPSRASWVSGDDFEGLVREARGFVADEDDLCGLLMERTDVTRGELTTWQYQRFAARLVKALLLARQLGNRQAEERALAILHSREGVHISPTKQEELLTVALRRAQEISRDTGLEISL